MAVTPQTNEAFLREVDEELRRDQVQQFWQRYGRLLIGALVAGLLVFGGYLYWSQYQKDRAGKQGEALSKVFEDLGGGSRTGATKQLDELAKAAAPGYRASAIFTQADLLLEKNDLKGAAAKFAAIAGDSSVGQPLRDLALIRQTSAEYDVLKPQTVIARLKPLATKESAWLGSAGEMVAIAHLRLNQNKEAGAIFGQIARSENVPESLRQRAVQMAGVLGVDAVVQNEEKKAQ